MNEKHQTPRVTALDGLRGWGAVTVLLYHLLVEIFPPSPQAGQWLYHLAPFNGTLAVTLFFIVSGYSLAIGFLHSGERRHLARILVGRYFRLAVPIVIATLFICACANFGILVDAARRQAALSPSDALRFAVLDVFFDNHDPAATPIPQLWTMPVELAGSIVVVALLWAVGRHRFRFIVYALALGVLCWLSPFLCAFIVGIVLAECSMIAARATLAKIAKLLLLPCLAATWILPGQGYATYLGVAAPLSFSLLFSPSTNAFLSNPLSRWLGRASFPLYLLHGLVIFSFGSAVIPRANGPVLLALAYLATIGLALLVAWKFRWADSLGVSAARRLGERLVPRRGGAAATPDSPSAR